MKIYLAHPSQSIEAGRDLEDLLTKAGFTVINPFNHDRESIHEKIERGIQFDEDDCFHIVFGDLYNLLASDAVIALVDKFSIGTPMEIAISVFWLQKPVFVLWRANHTNPLWDPGMRNPTAHDMGGVHPWLRVLTNVYLTEGDLIRDLINFSNRDLRGKRYPELIRGMSVIGVCGKSRSGKSSFSKYISDSYGYTHINLATPLYLLTERLLPEEDKRNLRESQLTMPEKYKEITTVLGGHYSLRTLQQNFGISVHDAFGSTILAQRAFYEVVLELCKNPSQRRFIIENLRLPYQVDFVRSLGGKIVWVHRENAGTLNYDHTTEISVTPEMCDIVVSASNLTELYGKADDIVKDMIENNMYRQT